jgi:galactokinase
MKEVASFFGKDVLREVTKEEVLAHMNEIREKYGDRAFLRAYHFFNENERVPHLVKALEDHDVNTFLQLIKESGDSSYKVLQNVYPSSDPKNQSLSIALTLTEEILGDHGVCRVHGGGFAGTIQAFVKDDFVKTYKKEIEKYFGEGSCHVLKIRKYGGKKVLA